MGSWRSIAAVLGMLWLVGIVAASDPYQTAANSIMFKSPLGLLIPLGIEYFVPAADAIMFYNYIGVAFVVLTAAMAGQSNESRFTVFVPLMAALMIFIGWLQAPDPTTYWGMIVGCLLFGALMYINDMNHEKYGLPGPGSKIITIAMMIIVFEASVVLMANTTFNPLSDAGNAGTAQKSLTCGGYGYSCDSNGNIDLSSSVSAISGSGGATLDVVSVVTWAAAVVVAMIKFIILVVGAVLLFSVVLMATYPALAASPQAVLILGIMQFVIWGIYMVAFFNWFYKPSFETAQV